MQKCPPQYKLRFKALKRFLDRNLCFLKKKQGIPSKNLFFVAEIEIFQNMGFQKFTFN